MRCRAARSKTGGLVALRDENGDGRFETKENFGDGSSTGIALRNGYLYVAKVESVERWKMTPGQLKPAGPPEVVVEGLPTEHEHHDKGIAFDGKGSLYINIGSPSNACQSQDRQKGIVGQDPCPLLETHGGIWKFDENKLHQKEADGREICDWIAPGTGDHLARRRALYRDEQPRPIGCSMAGANLPQKRMPRVRRSRCTAQPRE